LVLRGKDRSVYKLHAVWAHVSLSVQMVGDEEVGHVGKR
jgi:hypothetical protein